MYKIISINDKYPKVDSTEFSSNVSLTDYDIVIVDPDHVKSSFPKSDLSSDNKYYLQGQKAHILWELIERRQSEFLALLSSGKLVVSFLNPFFEVVLTSNNERVTNYSWLPGANNIVFTRRLINNNGSGLRLVEQNHLFSPYYLAFQKELSFNAYVSIAASSFGNLGDVFISNSANQVVGFSQKISKGIVIFVPKYKATEENNQKFVGILLQIAKKYFGSEMKTPTPDWTNAFFIPGVDLLDEKIQAVEKKILEFKSQKSDIEKERDILTDYKSPLYEQGHVLEKKVIDALRLMGFKAETLPGENTDFDVVLESEEGRAIAEVEGKDDSAIHKDKIDQLLSAINQDGENRDSFAKGVLVGNHYRNKTLAEREEPFTKTVVNLAKQYRYALVTTVELYNATIYFLQHPEDKDCMKACRQAIFEAEGIVVKFPIPEEKSKE